MRCPVLNLNVKIKHEAFEDKCKILTLFSEAKLWLVNLKCLHDLHDTSVFGCYEREITDMIERKYFKTMKNHQKWI